MLVMAVLAMAALLAVRLAAENQMLQARLPHLQLKV
jgi:hypothetical protein